MVDWSKLQTVHDGARANAVAFTLNYVDVNDEWYFTVESVEAGENWIGKPTHFDAAVNDVVNWLRRIGRSKV